MPIDANRLWDTAEDARAASMATLDMRFCMVCGHLFNAAFDEKIVDYGDDYENSQMFSPRFAEFASTLVEHLVEAYSLHGRNIVEIGGGKGDFLEMLCAFGNNRGTSIDPSYSDGSRACGTSGHLTFIRDYYSERYAGIPANFICCRHTLEHIWDATAFLSTVRRAIGTERTPVYFEVPNGAHMLRSHMVADMIYAHCSYFTPSSLLQLFVQCGFNVKYIHEAFEGQFLSIGAVPVERTEVRDHVSPRYTDLPSAVADFREAFDSKVNYWNSLSRTVERKGERAIVWGAGAKTVMFLNALTSSDPFPYVVDISPRKTGRYISGTGHQIVAPDFLRTFRPEVILIANPIYEAEIRTSTASFGLDPEYILI